MKPITLAIIPARGGSKGIPKKNIRVIAGKPLIAYTIEAAKGSRFIDRIIVSTDNAEIMEVSRLYGAEIIKRPIKLAQDNSQTIDTVFHVLKSLEKNKYIPDNIIILQPTSPLRTSEDIDNAIELYIKSNCESVVSVTEYEHTPFWAYEIENGLIKPVFGKKHLKMRRQKIKMCYRPNGSIYIANTKILKKFKSFYCNKTIPFIMSFEKSVDIDTEFDLKLCNYLIKSNEDKIKIDNTWIGKDCPIFIIAEAGVNHNGSLELARKMVDVAKDAGANAIKFQTFITENVITKNADKADYQKINANLSETQFDMVKKLELSSKDFKELLYYCRRKEIMFLSSPFDIESTNLLHEIGVPAFKIASGEITNFALLKNIATKGKPVILSTGMSNLKEVEDAFIFLKENNVKDIILLQCTTQYPTNYEDVNLKAMETLRNTFNIIVGLSDHTPGTTIPIAAAALGACVIEKHFTLDKNLPGPDHKASLNPIELKFMVTQIRNVEKAMGDGLKEPRGCEKEIKKVARKSIVASVDIPRGVILTEKMLAFKRPGTGLEPKKIDLIIGKKTRQKIMKDDIISLDMVIEKKGE